MTTQRALVTGGLGFVGSNLVDRLINLGWNVHVVDDLSSGKVEHKNPDATYTIADFKDYLSDPDESVDVIFHLAAEARIQPSFEDPLYTCHNNSHGSAVVAEFARQSSCKVVYAGSSSFYGGVYLNPYAFAKWQGEEVFKMYSAVYNSSCGIARFFNVYGPRNPLIGQYTPVVAIFEEQTRASRTLTVVGDGEQRRDFTHVYDICDGLIAISKGDWRGEVFNLGTGTNHSINELAEMFGGGIEYIPGRPGEYDVTLADYSKAEKMLGWKPFIDLEDYVNEIC